MGYNGYTMSKSVRNSVIAKIVAHFEKCPDNTTFSIKDFILICEEKPGDRTNSLRDTNNFQWMFRSLKYTLNTQYNRSISKRKDKYILCSISALTNKTIVSEAEAPKPDTINIVSQNIDDLLFMVNHTSNGEKKPNLIFNAERLNKKIIDQENSSNIIFIRDSILEEVYRRLMREMSMEDLYKSAEIATERLKKIECSILPDNSK